MKMNVRVIFLLMGLSAECWGDYTASVVEFQAAEVTWEDIKNEPFAYFDQNLEKMRAFVQEAKTKGADIIVFPEYGLQSLMVSAISPELASGFSQVLPNMIPEEGNLCSMDSVGHSQAILKDLSCIALRFEIYLVVNILTMQWNSETEEYNHYNTNVAFNRRGSIVASYRKFHSYHEPVVTHIPSKPDISFFDTDFSQRIGLMTCFDIFFAEPSKGLMSAGVDAIALTSAWGDELPFLTAMAIHPGIARMLNTTILSSGHHYIPGGVTGSGIFTPERVLKYSWNEGPKLLSVPLSSNLTFPHDEEYVSKPKLGKEDLTGYSFMKLQPGERSLRLYANGTNCTLDYSLRTHDLPPGSGYVFIGKKGLRTFGGGFYELGVQVCGVIFCENLRDELSCSNEPLSKPKKSVFDYISLSGVFEAVPAPVSIDLEYRPYLETRLPFEFDSESNLSTYVSTEPIHNLYSFGLYGRLY